MVRRPSLFSWPSSQSRELSNTQSLGPGLEGRSHLYSLYSSSQAQLCGFATRVFSHEAALAGGFSLAWRGFLVGSAEAHTGAAGRLGHALQYCPSGPAHQLRLDRAEAGKSNFLMNHIHLLQTDPGLWIYCALQRTFCENHHLVFLRTAELPHCLRFPRLSAACAQAGRQPQSPAQSCRQQALFWALESCSQSSLLEPSLFLIPSAYTVPSALRKDKTANQICLSLLTCRRPFFFFFF